MAFIVYKSAATMGETTHEEYALDPQTLCYRTADWVIANALGDDVTVTYQKIWAEEVP